MMMIRLLFLTRAIAAERLHTQEDLLAVDGFGPAKAAKFAAAVCAE